MIYVLRYGKEIRVIESDLPQEEIDHVYLAMSLNMDFADKTGAELEFFEVPVYTY